MNCMEAELRRPSDLIAQAPLIMSLDLEPFDISGSLVLIFSSYY